MPDSTAVPQPKAQPPLPTPTLTPAAKASLDAFLTSARADGRHPAITLGATTAKGEIYFAQDGDRVFGEPDKGSVDPETRFQLFSMTKVVTAAAVLLLVERGQVTLDDEAVLAKHCPELVALPILTAITDGVPQLTPRTQPLTVRHLLTHTSGLAYDFTSPLIAEYSKVTGKPAHWSASVEGYTLPLIFEPGSNWCYSTGLDWAGILIERVSGLSLHDFFHRNIFAPLGLTEEDIGFYPTPTVLNKLQQVCGRLEDEPWLKHVESPRSFDLAKVEKSQLGGGGGLFGTPHAYLRFLQGVLQSQQPGGFLTPASFAELFTDSLPRPGEGPHGDSVHKGLSAFLTRAHYASPRLLENDAAQLGYSVGLLVNHIDSEYGRKKDSGGWSGLARTYFWLDPTTGIAGICWTQVLSLPPDSFTEVYSGYERALYDALAASASTSS